MPNRHLHSGRRRPQRREPTGGEFIPSGQRAYIALNKPYAVLSQFSPPDGSDKRTLAEFAFPPDVYPVGRLDYDSEGLLLLSDDPALNALLLHPSRRHERTYLAQVEGTPSPDALARLEHGVVLEGKPTLPAKAAVIAPPLISPRPVPIRFRRDIPTAWIALTLIEGRNRQVRKMTAAVGHPTLRLVRTAIGGLTLADLALAPGQWRYLSADQLRLAMQL
ncbi:MAG: rluE [Chlorobi bacterium]|nr:rluE [Chlorobiota bacterium]